MATGLLRIPHLPVLVLLTGLLPALALAALAVVRRDSGRGTPAHRAVRSGHGGPASLDHSSPLGRTLGWLFEHVPVVGAFRTTNKVGAVLVLGAGTRARDRGLRADDAPYDGTLAHRGGPGRGRSGRHRAAVHPAVTGRLFTVEYDVPDYWRAAAADINDADDGSRVWFLPGQSQADYAWTEPIPDDLDKALLERPSVIRYTLPTASAHSANLLLAADTTLQERTAPPPLRAYARYLGVGQLLVRRDQRWQPWHGAPPAEVDAQVRGSVASGRERRTESRARTPVAHCRRCSLRHRARRAPDVGSAGIGPGPDRGRRICRSRRQRSSACWTASCRSDISPTWTRRG